MAAMKERESGRERERESKNVVTYDGKEGLPDSDIRVRGNT
jgi:hypothetical protein